MKLTAVVLAAVLLLSACATAKYQIPKEDLEFADAVGRAELAKFIEHYRTLHEEKRSPTDTEFGYWTAKYEQIETLYLLLASRIEESNLDWSSLVELINKILKATVIP